MENFHKLSIKEKKNYKQKFLIHLNKLILYYLYNKYIIVRRIFYAHHSNNNDIIIKLCTIHKKYKKHNFEYIIKLNNSLNITSQLQNLELYINSIYNKYINN